jgi:hypothetical protein
MKKLFLFMIIVLLNIVCFGENEKLKDLELYKFRSGGVVGEGYGGIDYILNTKNSKEILLYFKIYSSEKEIGDFKFTESRLYLGEKELEDKKSWHYPIFLIRIILIHIIQETTLN